LINTFTDKSFLHVLNAATLTILEVSLNVSNDTGELVPADTGALGLSYNFKESYGYNKSLKWSYGYSKRLDTDQ